MITNWAGNFTYSAAEVARPRSVAQLQELVAAAPRVKALGSRHSFNRVADTPGLLVSTADLELDLVVDGGSDGEIVIVPGGRPYSDVIPALAARGRAFLNLGSLPHISIAGAAATGTHGSGSGNRCLAAAVTAVELVHADGELVVIGQDDPDFGGSVLALGALGVVTRVWMRTQPGFAMRQSVWRDAPLASVLANLDDILDSAYSVSLFRQPGRSEIVDQIWVKSRAEDEAPDGRRWGATPATTAMHPIVDHDPAAASPQFGVEHAWHEVLPHFRASFTPSSGQELQTEYFVGRPDAPAAMEALLALELDDLAQVMEFRAIAADDLWLGTAHGRDSFALHLTWVDDEPAVRDACARVERALAPFAPRPHWGKVFAMDADQLRACYPRLPDFAALAARYDPRRTFGNDYLERFVY